MGEVRPFLMKSFASHRGQRGVHFYDSEQAEFLPWEKAMKSSQRFPEAFTEKLIEAMANYDPDSEFITVSAGGGQLTIEMFKASGQ